MSTAKRQNIALKISLFPGETMAKSKSDIERDKSKIDPWKVIHFEPVWGIRKDCQMDEVNAADSEYGPLVDEIETTKLPLPKPEVPKTEFEIRNEKRKERRKRLAALAAAEAEAKKSKNSSNKDVKNEENENESDSDENQPLIKKIKSDPNQNDYQKQAVTTSDDKKPKAEIEIEDDEKEKVKVEKTEEVIQPDLILEEVQDEIMEEEGVVSERDGATPTSPKLETVIEEPVSLIEEDDNSISDPPLRSCSVDQEAEVVSIPPSPPPLGVHPAGGSGSVGGVASQAATPSPTPPTLSVTPIPVSAGLPAEFMANMSDAAMNIPSVSSTIVASSPASIRSARGNSITFSSSRYVML